MEALMDTIFYNKGVYITFILGIVLVIYAIIFTTVKIYLRKEKKKS